MKVDSFLISVVGIVGIVVLCIMAVAYELDGKILYVGISTIAGLSGYNIRKTNSQKGMPSNKSSQS